MMTEFKIEKQDSFGNGIIKNSEKITFVDKGLPGDIVKLELTNTKKSFSKARITEIVTESNMREVVKCPYYDFCGGCHLLHQKYKDQLEFKVKKVKELVNRIGKIDIELNDVDIVSDKQFNYRNKVVLHNLGFYKEKSNESVSIDYCFLVNNEINKLISILKKSVIIPEEVLIRVTSIGEKMIVINGNIDKNILEELKSEVTCLKMNNRFLTKREKITEKILDYEFEISDRSFFQVNYNMTVKMYQYIRDLVKKLNVKKALDLYCGTGTIGILISKYVDNVEGIEVILEAINDANCNKEKNNIKNIEFICDKVENKIDNYKNIDLIIVDPPRSGLDKKTKEILLNIKAKTIIYTSCDPATLSRDLLELNKSYIIESIKLFDMFPNTYHVECVCLLKLR